MSGGIWTGWRNLWWGTPDEDKISECTSVSQDAMFLLRTDDLVWAYQEAMQDCQRAVNRNGRDEGACHKCLSHRRYIKDQMRLKRERDYRPQEKEGDEAEEGLPATGGGR